ncbi:MAG: DNA-binding protein WhiA, partial [Anaerovoracaceae bacterium]
MSFASDTKNELARIAPEKKCCMLAEIAGFIRVSGKLRLVGGGKFKLLLTSENPAVARHLNRLIKEYFNVETSIEVGQGNTLKKGKYYSITIGPEDLSEQILR